jgi:superfamily II DNA or RNA helicase
VDGHRLINDSLLNEHHAVVIPFGYLKHNYNDASSFEFHRIIFDEPQEIVQANFYDYVVTNLKSQRRWALTATPYPYLIEIMQVCF